MKSIIFQKKSIITPSQNNNGTPNKIMVDTTREENDLIMVDPMADTIDYWTSLVGDPKTQKSTAVTEHVELNLFENAANGGKNQKHKKRDVRKRIKTMLENCPLPTEQVKKAVEFYVNSYHTTSLSIDKVDPKHISIFDMEAEKWVSAEELQTKKLVKRVEDAEFNWDTFERMKDITSLVEFQKDFDKDLMDNDKPATQPSNITRKANTKELIKEKEHTNARQAEKEAAQQKEKEKEKQRQIEKAKNEAKQKEKEKGQERESERDNLRQRLPLQKKGNNETKDNRKPNEKDRSRDSNKENRSYNIPRRLKSRSLNGSRSRTPSRSPSPRHNSNPYKGKENNLKAPKDFSHRNKPNNNTSQGLEPAIGDDQQAKLLERLKNSLPNYYQKTQYKSNMEDDYVVTFSIAKPQSKAISTSNPSQNSHQKTGSTTNNQASKNTPHNNNQASKHQPYSNNQPLRIQKPKRADNDTSANSQKQANHYNNLNYSNQQNRLYQAKPAERTDYDFRSSYKDSWVSKGLEEAPRRPKEPILEKEKPTKKKINYCIDDGDDEIQFSSKPNSNFKSTAIPPNQAIKPQRKDIIHLSPESRKRPMTDMKSSRQVFVIDPDVVDITSPVHSDHEMEVSSVEPSKDIPGKPSSNKKPSKRPEDVNVVYSQQTIQNQPSSGLQPEVNSQLVKTVLSSMAQYFKPQLPKMEGFQPQMINNQNYRMDQPTNFPQHPSQLQNHMHVPQNFPKFPMGPFPSHPNFSNQNPQNQQHFFGGGPGGPGGPMGPFYNNNHPNPFPNMNNYYGGPNQSNKSGNTPFNYPMNAPGPFYDNNKNFRENSADFNRSSLNHLMAVIKQTNNNSLQPTQALKAAFLNGGNQPPRQQHMRSNTNMLNPESIIFDDSEVEPGELLDTEENSPVDQNPRV